MAVFPSFRLFLFLTPWNVSDSLSCFCLLPPFKYCLSFGPTKTQLNILFFLCKCYACFIEVGRTSHHLAWWQLVIVTYVLVKESTSGSATSQHTVLSSGQVLFAYRKDFRKSHPSKKNGWMTAETVLNHCSNSISDTWRQCIQFIKSQFSSKVR